MTRAAEQRSMSMGRQRIGRIGTFEGRAGSQGRTRRLALADAMVDLQVTQERENPESGGRLIELAVSAEFPANEVEIRFEVPEHAAERLREALEPVD